jgi:RNA polymerase sigma factor (sigma-70 family)
MTTATLDRPAKPKHDLLTATEERELSGRWQQFGDLAARNRLVECNQALARKIASDYPPQGVPSEDLYQAGITGLIRACDTYNPDVARFSTYASQWILQSIRGEIAQVGTLIRTPAHLKKGFNAIHKGEEPRNVNLKLLAAANFARKAACQGWVGMGDPDSLGEVPAKEPEDHCSTLPVGTESIPDLLAVLEPREALVIRLRYGLGDDASPMRLDAIGKIVKVTRERVRQIELSGLRKMRAKLGVAS